MRTKKKSVPNDSSIKSLCYRIKNNRKLEQCVFFFVVYLIANVSAF